MSSLTLGPIGITSYLSGKMIGIGAGTEGDGAGNNRYCLMGREELIEPKIG